MEKKVVVEAARTEKQVPKIVGDHQGVKKKLKEAAVITNKIVQ